MSLLTAEEYVAHLALPKPMGGEPGSLEFIELQKWHYAQLQQGIEKMRRGDYDATQEQAKNYIAGNEAAMAEIEKVVGSFATPATSTAGAHV